MRLLEYEAKQVLAPFGFSIPPGVVIRPTTHDIGHALAGCFFPAMVKAQVPIGGRGKAGAVLEVCDAAAAERAVRRLLETRVRGYTVEAVLVEARASIRREFFLALTYHTVAKKVVLLASGAGGVDVNATSEKAPESVIRRSIDVRRGLYDFEAREVASQVGLGGRDLLSFAATTRRAADAFLALDCTLLEINPLALAEDGNFLLVDTHLEVDDDALFRQTHLEKVHGISQREASGRTPTDNERQAAAVDALDHRGVAGRVIEFPGNLGLLIGGGGASLTAFDAIRKHGGQPANYCEIGGNPSVRKVTELTKLILSRPGVNRIAVISNVVSNTRVDLFARGVIKGILELGKDPARIIAVFRVPGSWEEEGFALLRHYRVPFCDRTVSIDEAARRAVTG